LKKSLILHLQKKLPVIRSDKFVPLLFILFFTGNIYAQISGTKLIQDLQNSEKGGKITINESDDITRLIDKHLYEESKKKSISGYRIVIFSKYGSTARVEADKTLALFIRNYPETKAYFTFDYPDYKIYVGDFRTRSEAIKFQKEVERDFPNAYYRPIKINYPAL
jgi:hypothetical protein